MSPQLRTKRPPLRPILPPAIQDIIDENAALREIVASQHQRLRDLCARLTWDPETSETPCQGCYYPPVACLCDRIKILGDNHHELTSEDVAQLLGPAVRAAVTGLFRRRREVPHGTAAPVPEDPDR